ncbi:MAG: hypothetical protein EOO13_00175 [Chitinophagaceae bacterium]|nr:MAG: hypothetical protein EOO13_00175 [Chitinophagaceae bacterium]
MKTAEKNATAVQGTAAKNNQTANRVENRPSLTGKEAKQDEKATDQKPAQTPQVEKTNPAEVKTDSTAAVDNQPANTGNQSAAQEVKDEPKAEAPKADEPKAEIRYIKPAMNLEQTLKSVEGLHRLSIQRLALIARIKTLEDFEVKLVEENDELEANPYQGCKLIIEDDKRRQFVTNTPNLIRMVSQFIFDACNEKLAEIEANITFPNA